MRASAGKQLAWSWTTDTVTGFGAEARAEVPLQADNEFHQYEIELEGHPQWRGKKITSLRFNPVEGVDKAMVEIAWIRGYKSGSSARSTNVAAMKSSMPSSNCSACLYSNSRPPAAS